MLRARVRTRAGAMVVREYFESTGSEGKNGTIYKKTFVFVNYLEVYSVEGIADFGQYFCRGE